MRSRSRDIETNYLLIMMIIFCIYCLFGLNAAKQWGGYIQYEYPLPNISRVHVSSTGYHIITVDNMCYSYGFEKQTIGRGKSLMKGKVGGNGNYALVQSNDAIIIYYLGDELMVLHQITQKSTLLHDVYAVFGWGFVMGRIDSTNFFISLHEKSLQTYHHARDVVSYLLLKNQSVLVKEGGVVFRYFHQKYDFSVTDLRIQGVFRHCCVAGNQTVLICAYQDDKTNEASLKQYIFPELSEFGLGVGIPCVPDTLSPHHLTVIFACGNRVYMYDYTEQTLTQQVLPLPNTPSQIEYINKTTVFIGTEHFYFLFHLQFQEEQVFEWEGSKEIIMYEREEKRVRNSSLSMQFMKQVIGFPNGKRLWRCLAPLYMLLDHFWLYGYHNRSYPSPTTHVFHVVQILNDAKMTPQFLSTFTTTLKQRTSVTPQEEYDRYTSEEFQLQQGSQVHFYTNTHEILVNFLYTVVLLFVMYLLRRCLLSMWVPCGWMRKNSRGSVIWVAVLQANMQYIVFMCFKQLEVSWSYSWMGKVNFFYALVVLWVCVMYAFGVFLLVRGLWPSQVGVFVGERKPQLRCLKFWGFGVGFKGSFMRIFISSPPCRLICQFFLDFYTYLFL